MAVDWVVAKSKYEQAIRKSTSTNSQAEEESEMGEDNIGGDLSELGEDGESDDNIGGTDSCEDDDSIDGEGPVSDEGAESISTESEKRDGHGQSSSDVIEGRTLFIR